MWISYSRYWISDHWSVDIGFRIPIITEWNSGPESISWIPDFKAQDSGFQNFPNSGIQITVYGAIIYTL